MAPIDPEDADNSLEDCARQLDQFVRTANSFHVKGDEKYTRSVECLVFMITNSFAQNTSVANQITKVELWLYCMRFNNILSIFRIVLFGLLMNYQDW
jgi:hypothetical protein